MKTKEQRPTPPNTWLTRLTTTDEKDREFVKVISMPEDAPLWEECTDEQWQEWQDTYEPEEPEPEVQEAEIVDEQ